MGIIKFLLFLSVAAFDKMIRATAFASLLASAQAAEYAVLVAGSNSYSNYRHQADVCHAYQVVKSKGIPESNIIVMAYDDIASNSQNPFPGKIFNKPTAAGVAGQDVYAGCNIDYKGSDVNPQNFLAVLTGTASGKNLKSTSADNVFVFFSDHGAAGLIAFPRGAGEVYKADLQNALDTMHSKNMYKKLTFYLETCESGSMFEGLSTPGVYTLSAASPSESSWGTYCGSDAMVDGKSIGSCLGDLFSVNWMEDSDVKDLTSETLKDQADIVTTKTDKSQVMQWGDRASKPTRCPNSRVMRQLSVTPTLPRERVCPLVRLISSVSMMPMPRPPPPRRGWLQVRSSNKSWPIRWRLRVHSIDSSRSCTLVTATNTMPCAMAPALPTTGIARRQLVKPLFSTASLMPTPVSPSSSSASLLRLVPSKHRA